MSRRTRQRHEILREAGRYGVGLTTRQADDLLKKFKTIESSKEFLRRVVAAKLNAKS